MAEEAKRSVGSEDKTAEKAFTVAAPQVSLPKGGGAIRGIGEKFTANPVTGTGSLAVPIALSSGRSGFGPQLSLTYNSGAGNDSFGLGWSLSLPSITRRTDKGLPQYDDAGESDVFILSGAEDLVPVLAQDSNGGWNRNPTERNGYVVWPYRPRIEGAFSRIERWTRISDGDTYWRSISRDNITTFYGKTAASRIADPLEPGNVFTWLISESRDDKGNAIAYEYVADDSANIDLTQVHERNRTDATRVANRYLKRIKYGNTLPTQAQSDLSQQSWLFEAVFDYGEGHATPLPTDADGREFVAASLAATQSWPARQDPFSRYRSGFDIRTYRLCRRVLMFHHFADELGTTDYLVRSTEFAYSESATASFITAVTQSGYVRQSDGTYLKRSLPRLEFEYSVAVVQSDVQEVDPASLANLPANVDGGQYQWLDLDGEGLQGILATYGDVWYYKRNLSPTTQTFVGDEPTISAAFETLTEVATLPGFAQAKTRRYQFLDLAGDGQQDCVVLDRPGSGFYKRTADAEWETFAPLQSVPNVDWNDPNLRFIDLDGDGRADVLVTEHDIFTWYPSLGKIGFDAGFRVAKPTDEEQGPAVILSDGTQTIFLADMTGDGLIDLVRVRNGSVCYWPNIGYARFGAKIEMDNAPWFEAQDLFDPSRIRLADIDGSGTADIIYLASGGVRLYFNQGGNSWSDPQALPAFPLVDDLSTVQAMDLFGNGTACLVWMSPLPNDTRRNMRYVDLMSGQKPHLLVSSVNNLGAETHVRYAPSTKFYLSDRGAGTPWMTKLPFPVQVVERVETCDRVSRNRFVTRYVYHHGYYDGFEREFRGFGMVEQQDTEELGALSASGAFPDAVNIDAASYVPPMLTKTWFHLGAFPRSAEISRIFQKEYYREGDFVEGIAGLTDAEFAAMQLPDTVLPPGLTDDETREAIRSLKGSMLRQEIYALDGTEAADRPYSVSEQNLTIKKLQAFGPNRHAVFFTHERESIDLHYERKLYNVAGRRLADPRTTHHMVLAFDDYGDVLQSATIAYGRRHDDPDPLLTDEDRAQQSRILISCVENTYTNAIDEEDAFRPPMPAETCSYELIKVAPESATPDITNLFGFDELAAKLAQASDGQHDLPFEDVEATGATQDHPYRRLIARARALYRKNDLSAGLPLGVVESLALPYENHKLAFTPDLLVIFQRNGQNLLADPAAVLHAEGGYVPGEDLKGAGLFPSSDQTGLWWVPSGRIFYSPGDADTASAELALAQAHFFLPRRFEDPFGTAATAQYDIYDLLLLETADALQNTVTIGTRNADGSIVNGNDYRVLQPALVTDPNGNRSQVVFDALELVAGSAAMGKATEALGDSLEGFTADLTQAQIDAFFADPKGPIAPILLGTAGARIVYDLFRYQNVPAAPGTANPAFAATIARETHVSDLAAGQASALQVSLSFSDGFGREIQKKIQAEPGPFTAGGPTVATRWVTSGWTIFNNKGKPVRQYEPFFDDAVAFKFGVTIGVSPVLFYDPAERVVATLHADHAWQKVIVDPWRQESWDANDTVLIVDPTTDAEFAPFAQRLPAADCTPSWYAQRSNGALGTDAQDAAQKAAIHAGTPSVTQFDSFGRTFLTFAWNRTPSNGAAVDERPRTSIALDISGKQLSVTDALGRKATTYAYDMLGTRIHQISIDAGERWYLNNCVGNPLRHWDSRDQQFRYSYDALRRPTQLFVQLTSAAGEILAEKTAYGEGQANDLGLNLRGRSFQVFDAAGIATHNAYDFKGNLLSGMRQFAQDYKNDIDWKALPALLAEIFTSSTSYDAFNRPVTLTTPDASIHRPTYNMSGLLARIDVNLQGAAATTSFVTAITYGANGLRDQITYGNGATTSYQYDPNTFRLTRLTTVRASDQASLQDLFYAYDPVGNITHIEDNADIQNTIYFRNQRVDPSSSYIYDALYRLIQATGREHLGQTNNSLNALQQVNEDDSFRMNLQQPGDGLAMGNYTERYTYDSVGNILSMAHAVSSGNWTRAYSYGGASNRLLATSLPGDATGQFSAKYSYDAHGNMLTMSHLPLMQWDFKDQLRATQQQVVNDGPGLRTYYVYESSGQRVRKVTENQNGVKTRERIYFGGYEIYREYSGGGVSLERETLHVMDDKQRLALVETRTQGSDNSAAQLIRYQFGNHLQSASLELDDKTQIISYEEYFPYGSTSYQAVRSQTDTPKRYRHTGKERDEENGFTYHGARYYAPWVGRWMSCDPKGGSNLYPYVECSPVMLRDANGKDGSSFWDTFKPGGTVFEALDSVANPTNPVAKGIVSNLAKRGDQLVSAPGAIADLYRKEGAAGVTTAVVVGVGHLVKETGEAAGDIAWEASHYQGPKSAEKIANRATDVLLNTADIVTIAAGGAGAAKGGLGGARAVATGARAGVKVVAAGVKDALEGAVQGGKALQPALAGGVSAVKGGEAALDAAATGVRLGPPGLKALATPPVLMSVAAGGAPGAGSAGGGSPAGPPVKKLPPGPAPKEANISARPKGGAALSASDAAAMADRGMTARRAFPRAPLHHVFPQAKLIQEWIAKRGIDIHEYVAELSEGEHSAVHAKGVDWNAAWKEFMRTNPNASEQQIFEFAGKLMDKYKISDAPLTTYTR